MWEFLNSNLATIIISTVLIIIFFFIIKGVIKNKKTCDANCGSCSASLTCKKDLLAELRKIIED